MADHTHLLLGWLITGVICAVIGAFIGWGKGAASMGFFYGLILGPLGLLLVAVAEDVRIQCPVCREMINPSARVCPKCLSNMALLRTLAVPQASRVIPREAGGQDTPKVIPKTPRVVTRAAKAVEKVTQALKKVSQALRQAPQGMIRKPLSVIRNIPPGVEEEPLAVKAKSPRVAVPEPPRVIPKASRFFIHTPGSEVHGPYNLAQIKALEECGVITAETRYCREGENEWKQSFMA